MSTHDIEEGVQWKDEPIDRKIEMADKLKFTAEVALQQLYRKKRYTNNRELNWIE